jgi:hypothetical protein
MAESRPIDFDVFLTFEPERLDGRGYRKVAPLCRFSSLDM